MSGAINFDDMEYAAPDELATLRRDLVMALATIQELNQRMAVVEQQNDRRLVNTVSDGGQKYRREPTVILTLRFPRELYERIPVKPAQSAGVPAGRSGYLKRLLVEAVLRDLDDEVQP